MTDERTLAFLQELERADSAAAATLAELDELAVGVERAGSRAAELAARLASLPGERRAAQTATDDAEAELEERRAAHTRAEGALADAERGRDRERVARARREEVRARDLASTAERRLASARAEEGRLVAEEEAIGGEAGDVVARAAELAAALRKRPGLADAAGEPPAGGLASIADWATDARAALFVARGRLAAEREALIRQANELGTLVLGEPLGASSAASIARRVADLGGR